MVVAINTVAEASRRPGLLTVTVKLYASLQSGISASVVAINSAKGNRKTGELVTSKAKSISWSEKHS
jgi:hypothetical protein